MWALDPPCARPTERLGADTPLALLAVLALGTAATWALVEHGALPSRAMQVAGVTAGHGALLATALAWARVRAASGVVAIALLALAASAAARGGVGALAYLGPPLWGVWLARRGGLARPRPRAPLPPRGAIVRVAARVLVSSRLLVSASRTLGGHLRPHDA